MKSNTNNAQQNLDNFWREYIAIGKEVLKAGREIGYGMSLIEVKFQDGEPAVIIRSITQNEKYANSEDAEEAIMSLMSSSRSARFDGARTFTLVYRQGTLNRVLLDEYANRLLK